MPSHTPAEKKKRRKEAQGNPGPTRREQLAEAFRTVGGVIIGTAGFGAKADPRAGVPKGQIELSDADVAARKAAAEEAAEKAKESGDAGDPQEKERLAEIERKRKEAERQRSIAARGKPVNRRPFRAKTTIGGGR